MSIYWSMPGYSMVQGGRESVGLGGRLSGWRVWISEIWVITIRDERLIWCSQGRVAVQSYFRFSLLMFIAFNSEHNVCNQFWFSTPLIYCWAKWSNPACLSLKYDKSINHIFLRWVCLTNQQALNTLLAHFYIRIGTSYNKRYTIIRLA